MYQVVIKTFVNDERQMDTVYPKVYKNRGWAERKAKELRKSKDVVYVYVRGCLHPVSKEEAKSAYCHCRPVWVDGQYGQEKIRPSGEYGSHAPAEELFHTSVDAAIGWWKHGDTTYYVEF